MNFLIFAIIVFIGYAAWRSFAYGESYSGNLSGLKAPVAIFDFDGTICPSFSLFVEHLNALSDEFGYKKINSEQAESFRKLDAQKVIKAIGVSRFKLPFLIRKIRKNAQKQLLELDLVPKMKEVLRELRSKSISFGILTSNSEENVRLYLKKYGIDFFDFIYSGNNLFGKGAHLKTILKKASLDPKLSPVFYVGDEARDMEAAKKAGIIAVAVPWGYNSPCILKQANPDHFCEKPEHLALLIGSVTLRKGSSLLN